MSTFDHTRWEDGAENKIDPDDGNSTLCEACCLPIFYTPIIPSTPYDQNNNNNNNNSNSNQVLHDGCGNDHLPPKLEGRHPLHPKKDLILQHQHQTNNNCCCSRCGSICGSSYYECADNDADCDFRLDLACALSINWIVHMSHPHKLTAIKGKSLSSLLCASCGTRHPEASTWQVWYVCIPCDFWVHPDCAILPSAIQIDAEHHPHPLLLKYLNQGEAISVDCGICKQGGDNVSSGWGCYVCFQCFFFVHTKCVVYSNPDHPTHFEPVLIRDAQVPGLLHLPIPNDTTSVMTHILTKIAAITFTLKDGASSSNITITSTSSSFTSNQQIHEHPLILHNNNDHHQTTGVARICNACVQLISPSDPFYSCCNNNNELVVAGAGGGCRDFFLHRCCAHLPTEITTQHWKHATRCQNNLTLVSKPHLPTSRPFNMFMCHGCGRVCNGFAYTCEECDFYVDAVCAFMHTPITYDGHAKSHILLSSNFWETAMCICCAQEIDSMSEIGYKCNSCRNFRIHAKCALLPDTLTHKFDRHPLKLINTDHHLLIRGCEQIFCEICENDIDDTRTLWYYGCKECDQYFHTGCIPCVDRLSKIKFGFTIRVPCHDCPLVAVRALSVEGYRCQCGRCKRIIITESDEIAFECSKCYFRIRRDCAAIYYLIKKVINY